MSLCWRISLRRKNKTTRAQSRSTRESVCVHLCAVPYRELLSEHLNLSRSNSSARISHPVRFISKVALSQSRLSSAYSAFTNRPASIHAISAPTDFPVSSSSICFRRARVAAVYSSSRVQYVASPFFAEAEAGSKPDVDALRNSLPSLSFAPAFSTSSAAEPGASAAIPFFPARFSPVSSVSGGCKGERNWWSRGLLLQRRELGVGVLDNFVFEVRACAQLDTYNEGLRTGLDIHNNSRYT